MKLTAGSAYSGVIEQYHEVNGFILAARPADIRVIGQAPVVSKNIFDMVSDGSTFSIYIPSKNKFIVGPANLERRAEKPIENLRPQHLVDALFWPVIADQDASFIRGSARRDVAFLHFNGSGVGSAAIDGRSWGFGGQLGNRAEDMVRSRESARLKD